MSHGFEGNSARDLSRDTSDDAYASRVTVAGRALAANLSVFWKTARLYDARNVAYSQSLQNLIDSLQALHSLGSDFVIQVVGDCLYINDQRLRVDVVGYSSHQFIVDELARRKVGGLRFVGGVERSEVQAFTRVFLGDSVQHPPDFERIVADCEAAGITRIQAVREMIRRGARHARKTDRAVRTGPVFDNHARAQALARFIGHCASDEIEIAAGLHGNDEADGAGGVGLCGYICEGAAAHHGPHNRRQSSFCKPLHNTLCKRHPLPYPSPACGRGWPSGRERVLANDLNSATQRSGASIFTPWP